MNETFEKLEQATARIERIIYLAGAMAAIDRFPDDLNDFLNDEDDDTIAECFGETPDWVDLPLRGDESAVWVCEWLRDAGKFGFLVQFATPVMKPYSPTGRTFSWGYYSTKWIYAETVEEAIDKGLAWVAERRAKEDAKDCHYTPEALCVPGGDD